MSPLSNNNNNNNVPNHTRDQGHWPQHYNMVDSNVISLQAIILITGAFCARYYYYYRYAKEQTRIVSNNIRIGIWLYSVDVSIVELTAILVSRVRYNTIRFRCIRHPPSWIDGPETERFLIWKNCIRYSLR